MINTRRQKIRKRNEITIRAYQSTTIDDLIKKLKECKEKVKDMGLKGVQLYISEGYIAVIGITECWETDEEYNRRIEAERDIARRKKERKRWEEDRERELYLRLKKKFEGVRYG